MIALEDLDNAFEIYWKDMDCCKSVGAYWSLLHVTVCLPDICAALRSEDGRTSRTLYEKWCNDYLKDPLISSSERYEMRCRVLHQGTASIKCSDRYKGFAYTKPALNGQTDHKRIDGQTLILDVGLLYVDVRNGVNQWISYILANAGSPEACNIIRNLPSLVQTRTASIPQSGGNVSDYLTIERSS